MNRSASGHAAAKATRTRLAVSVMRAAILIRRTCCCCYRWTRRALVRSPPGRMGMAGARVISGMLTVQPQRWIGDRLAGQTLRRFGIPVYHVPGPNLP